MSDSDVKTAWRGTLRKDHQALADRVVRDHWARMENGVDLEDIIESLLLQELREIPRTREEWAKIKAKAIVDMLKGE